MNNLRVYDLGANLLGLLGHVYLVSLGTHLRLLYMYVCTAMDCSMIAATCGVLLVFRMFSCNVNHLSGDI